MARKLKSRRTTLLIEAFKEVTKCEKYWNVWRTSEQWLEIMLFTFPELNEMSYTPTDFHRSLAVDPVLKHCFMNYGSMRNHHGIYLDRKQIKKQRITAIYCCTPNTAVTRPSSDKAWWEELAKRTPSARQQTKTDLVDVLCERKNKRCNPTN